MKKSIDNLQINRSIFNNKKFKLYAGLAVTALSITSLLYKANSLPENKEIIQNTKLEQKEKQPAEIKCNFLNKQEESNIIIIDKNGEIVAIIGNDQNANLTAYLSPGEYIIIGNSKDESKKSPTIEFEIKDYNEQYELYIDDEIGKLKLVQTNSISKTI